MLIGTTIIHETTKKIVQVKEWLKVVRSIQKSYVDASHKPLEFKVKDRVLLKVVPWISIIRFGKWGKLNPFHIGPFEILPMVGLVPYKLNLPQELNKVHNTFHMLNLKMCLSVKNLIFPTDEIQVNIKLTLWRNRWISRIEKSKASNKAAFL